MFILEQKWGNDGYSFWFKLLEILGSSDGHYICLGNPSTREFLVAKTHLEVDLCYRILDLLAELEAIDRDLWETEKVIWCQNLVDNVGGVYQKRRADLPQKPSFRNQKPRTSDVSGAETPHSKVSDAETPQSKVKESKVNKSKVNKKETESCINPLSPETSVEKAFFEEPLGEEKLTELIRYYSQNVSPATPVNITDLQYDLADFDGDLELLKEAVNICARNNERRYSYFAGILKNWRANGVKTYADYLNNERERADKKTQNKQYQNKPVRQEKVPEWMNQANGEEEKLSPEEQAEFERQMQELLGGE